MSSISSGTSVTAQVSQTVQAGQHAHRGHRHPGGPDFKAAFSAAAQAVGVDASKVDDLQKQIDDAVKTARKNSTTGTDTRQAVRDAVDGVLKANNIDPAKFHEAMKTQMEALRSRNAQNVAPPRPMTDSPRDNDADDQLASGPILPGSLNTVA